MKEHCIAEPIGHFWRDELVWLPLADERPARVFNRTTGKALPSQISGQRVCVRVSLKPNEKLTLLIKTDGKKQTANRLGIERAGDFWTVTNRHIAVRIPQTSGFDPGEAPGPIVSIRQEGKWIGRGLWGPSGFMGRVETTILDRGPLFARWRTRYIVGGRQFSLYECTLYDGEDFVRVRDETLLGAGRSFRFQLADDDKPKEWFTYGGGEAVDVGRGPMGKPPSRKGWERANEFSHIDFHSGHFQMSHSWFGFLVESGAAVGVCEINGGHWKIPGRNRIRVLRCGPGIEFHFPVDGGSKEFALVCGDAAEYAPSSGLSRFCHLRRKYNDLPLEKVRHWVTGWPLREAKRPLLYPRGTAERWEEKLKSWPELAAAYRGLNSNFIAAQLPTYLVTGDAALRDKLLEWIDRELNTAIGHALTNGFLRLIIFDGRALKVALEAIDILRWRNEIDTKRARSFARRIAFLAYCFADANFWPWDSCYRDRLDPRSIGPDYWDDIGPAVCPPNFATEYYTSFSLVGLAYPEHPAADDWVRLGVEMFDRQLEKTFFDSGGYCESLNYHTHVAGMLTQFAVALRAGGHRNFFEHPRFKLNYEFFLNMLTPPVAMTGSARELAGQSTNLNPPVNDRAVLITNWGNSGHDCSGYLVPPIIAIAAGIYAERDPDYARRLMTGWRMSPQQFCNDYVGFSLLALGHPDLPDTELALESKLVEGLGATMRSGDVFAWIKCGEATHHNCRDEGGLVLYAHGAPIIGDFGYHAVHQDRVESGYETWKHTCVTFGGKQTSAYLGTETVLPPELWRSTPETDLLVAYIPIEYVVPEGASYLDIVRIPRIEYRRYILFVKPYYFVIFDHIPSTTLSHTWWLHALADDIELSKQRAFFHGRFGVNLDVQIIWPAPATITAGKYSVQRHIRIEQTGAGHHLTVLTPLCPGKQPPEATYSSDQQQLEVRGKWGTDTILITPERQEGLVILDRARI